METLTELSRITPIRESVLFSEVLTIRINSKFKKVKVVLTQQGDGQHTNTVYNLQIAGIKNKYNLDLSFLAEDVCFQLLDEQQELIMADQGCLPCFGRNYYPPNVYTRLTIILYIDTGESSKGAQCVKIPLLQRGPVNSATVLHKLEDIIYRITGGKEFLRHWQVSVMHCANLIPQEQVYIALSKQGLAIIHSFQIIFYFPLALNRLKIGANSDTGLLQLIQTAMLDKQWNIGLEPSSEVTRVYKFHTVHAEQIKSCLEFLQEACKNQTNMRRPNAHFNIRHSEFSASLSGHIPGTTSDNFIITPHFPQMHSSGSSSSNGHIPGTTSVNVMVHMTPTPHLPINQSSGPHMVPEQFSDNTVEPNHPTPPPHKLLLVANGSSSSNGHIPGSKHMTTSHKLVAKDHEVSKVKVKQLNLIGVTSSDGSGSASGSDYIHPPTSHQVTKVSSGTWPHEISPMDESKPSISSILCESSPSQRSDGLENYGGLVDFDLDDGDIEAPLPPPCGKGEAPVQDISDVLYPSAHHQLIKKKINPPPRRMSPLMRSQSVRHLSDSELATHTYCNVEQALVQMRNIHEDIPYYHFYYNKGFVRFVQRPSMKKKLKRRSRLSDAMDDLDMNLLEKHEKWYDQCFKTRDKDLRFLRIHRMNIKPEAEEKQEDYSYVSLPEREASPDDPYWNSELCLTLQAKLQKQVPDVQDVFDMTKEQYVGVNVLLSLVPSENNWKTFAEAVGLMSQDLSIIEHYCYTYRELAAEVVFDHWALQQNKGKASIPCTRDSLETIVSNLGRDDVRNVLSDTTTNLHQEPIVTHF